MSNEEFEDPEWGSDKPMTERVDRKLVPPPVWENRPSLTIRVHDSVDGREAIASGRKPEEQGFESPSTLPSKIEYIEEKPGLWVSKDNIFTLQMRAMGMTQEEIDEVNSKVAKMNKWPSRSMFILMILFGCLVGELITRYILGW